MVCVPTLPEGGIVFDGASEDSTRGTSTGIRTKRDSMAGRAVGDSLVRMGFELDNADKQRRPQITNTVIFAKEEKQL